jgi:Rap1a immunity proteins
MDSHQLTTRPNNLPGCKAFVDKLTADFLQGFCVGQVSALALMMKARGTAGEGGPCIPPGVTVGQEVRVVVRYIENQPNRMHEDFRALALAAFWEAWPCRTK